MDFDTQLSTEHLFMESRVCRVCGEEKTLLADFYKCRSDSALRSSYAYECKDCAKKRVLKNYHSIVSLGLSVPVALGALGAGMVGLHVQASNMPSNFSKIDRNFSSASVSVIGTDAFSK